MYKPFKFLLYLSIPTGITAGLGFYQYSGAVKNKEEIEKRLNEIKERDKKCSENKCCEENCKSDKSSEECKDCCDKCEEKSSK